MSKRMRTVIMFILLMYGVTSFCVINEAKARVNYDDKNPILLDTAVIGGNVEMTEKETELPAQPPTEAVTEAPTEPVTEKVTVAETQPPTEEITEETSVKAMETTVSPTQSPTEATKQTTKAPSVKETKKPKKEPVKEAKKPKKEKKVVNNTVPSQTQNINGLSGSDVSLIKNTIMSNFSGAYNNNMQNLAIYMANNGMSDANSALNKLCQNPTIKVTGKIATATANSNDSSDIIDAAEKLADTLRGSGKYGIGISVSRQGDKYKITAAIAVQTN